MKPKNLFLFIFIFLINTKILVRSDDYGYILVYFEEGFSGTGTDIIKTMGVTASCDSDKRECKLSFSNNFKDFNQFFPTALTKASNIERVDLSNLKVTPEKLAQMFSGCARLKIVEGFSNLKTDEVTTMKKMFEFCNNLQKIDMSNLDLSKVTDMSYMFQKTSWENVDIIINMTNVKISSLTSMSYMFYDVYIGTIDLTNVDTSKVNDMYYMFGLDIKNDKRQVQEKVNNAEKKHSGKLEIIGLNGFDTSQVTRMAGMFANSMFVTSLDLSHFDTSKVADMQLMFWNCVSLKYLDISKFNLNSKKFDNIFHRVHLRYINLYSAIYTKSSSDFSSELLKDSMNEGLKVCQSQNILEEDWLTYKCCEFINNIFSCPSYIKVKYGKETEYINGFINDDKGEENKYRINIIDYIDDGEKNVMINESLTIAANSEVKIYLKEDTKSLEHFFDSEYDPNVENITTIDLSEILLNDLTQTNSLFKGCNSLKSLNLKFPTKKTLTSIDSMFSGCQAIQTLNLTGIKISSITNMSHMFEGCTSVRNIYLDEDWDTSKTVDMNSMFAECRDLREINISHFQTTSLTDMSKMFFDCRRLRKINLTTFDTKEVKNMNQLFYNCSSLEFLDINNFDFKKTESFNDIFTNVNKILYIELRNIKNEKNIWESLYKNETFYICQSREIITNPNAYNCCVFMLNSSECDYIAPSTIMIIETTIPPIITTQLKIPTTQLKIPTTQLIKPLTHRIIKPPTTVIVPIKTTEVRLEYEIKMVLTGIGKLTSRSGFLVFNLIITCKTPGYTFTKRITLIAYYEYIDRLRRLKEIEIEIICTLQGDGNSKTANYNCELPGDLSKLINLRIADIKIDEGRYNINLALSPLAKRYLDHVQDTKDLKYDLANSEIFILDHCFMYRKANEKLNISGIIEDSQPILNNNDIVVMLNTDSKNNSVSEVNCTISNIKEGNYTLICEINESMTGDLQSYFQDAISIIDNNVIIINIDSYSETVPEFERGRIRYNINKNHKNAVTIIAIVLASVTCLGALIATLIICRKKTIKEPDQIESDIYALKTKIKN